MRKKRWVVAILLLVESAKAAEPLISVTFSEAPVAEVLQTLAEYRQLNVMIAPEVGGTLSLNLRDIPWSQAWSLVCRMAQVSSEQQGNVLLVFPPAWHQENERQAAVRKEQRQQTLPLSSLTLRLQYADASVIFTNLQKERAAIMTPRGSVTLDLRTNSLLLRDTAQALNDTRRWIEALDVPLQQVELVAHIVTISQEKLRELGVRWGMSGEAQINKALRASQFHLNLTAAEPAARAGLSLARLDGHLLELELSALEQENQVEIIASPHLFTSHQQPASIKQGTEIPYEVSRGNNGNTSMEFREAMLGMDVTPVIQANGRILLKLRISQNVPGRAMRTGEKEVITIDKQEITTQVTVQDGQTLVLGGIFQQQRDSGRSQVPLLGDIPVIGTLFRRDASRQKRRELVIFITPRLTAG